MQGLGIAQTPRLLALRLCCAPFPQPWGERLGRAGGCLGWGQPAVPPAQRQLVQGRLQGRLPRLPGCRAGLAGLSGAARHRPFRQSLFMAVGTTPSRRTRAFCPSPTSQGWCLGWTCHFKIPFPCKHGQCFRTALSVCSSACTVCDSPCADWREGINLLSCLPWMLFLATLGHKSSHHCCLNG